jgi:HK97 family phage portal protein
VNDGLFIAYQERGVGILTNLFSPAVQAEQRAYGAVADLGGYTSMAGVGVSEMGSLRNMAVFACVGIISQSLASIPLVVYERAERGRRRAIEHPLYSVMHDQGNGEMTAFELRETRLAHCALWGNAYAEIEYDDQLNVVGLWPLAPDRVGIERDRHTGQLMYTYMLNSGQGYVLPAWRVQHLRYMMIDGVTGISPIRQAMNAIGLAQATEEFGSNYFRNGSRPSIILKVPQKLSKEAYERLRSSFAEKWSGLSNSHRVNILEEGITPETIGIPPEEAQFLATRQFQTAEIARLYRVPLDMLADAGSATYASVEQHAINLRVYTLLNWARRDEQALMRDLLTPEERQRFYIEYLLDGLERADIGTRSQALNTMRQGGAITANEWRERENLEPLDGGDELLQPLNMAPVDAGSDEEGTDVPEDPQRAHSAILAAMTPVFDDAASRVTRRIAQDVRKAGGSALRKGGPSGYEAWLLEFMPTIAPVVCDVMRPSVRALAIQAGGSHDTAEIQLRLLANDLAERLQELALVTMRETVDLDEEGRLSETAAAIEGCGQWLARFAQRAAVGEQL